MKKSILLAGAFFMMTSAAVFAQEGKATEMQIKKVEAVQMKKETKVESTKLKAIQVEGKQVETEEVKEEHLAPSREVKTTVEPRKETKAAVKLEKSEIRTLKPATKEMERREE